MAKRKIRLSDVGAVADFGDPGRRRRHKKATHKRGMRDLGAVGRCKTWLTRRAYE